MTVDRDYQEERICTYKGETYSVRDNGAVMRHPIPNGRKRPNDSIWTFGIKDNRGYANISGERIHRIVATAFHGKPEIDSYVVDHIDTNRMNNRPENLRWCSRLENMLNENTIWNIERMTGRPIEEILEDPTILHKYNHLPKDVRTMWPVSKAENDLILKHLKERNNIPARYEHETYKYPKGVKESATPNAIQDSDWSTYEFPSCPESLEATLDDYYENIKEGELIAKRLSNNIIVTEKAFNRWHSRICLKTYSCDNNGEPNVKEYGLMIISKLNGKFLHKGEIFFSEEGMEKYFTIAMGNKWTKGEVFDDGVR